MTAYDFTKLTAELKSDNVQYRNKIINITAVLDERYYVTFALWHEPSVCCL